MSYPKGTVQNLFNHLGEMMHDCDKELSSMAPDTPERIYMQVMRGCYEEAYRRLDLILNRNLAIDCCGAYSAPDPQSLTLMPSQLKHILDGANRVSAEMVELVDDGFSFEALATNARNSDARVIYQSESLQ